MNNDNNLDETKIFKANDSSDENIDDTLNIPFVKKQKNSVEDTIKLDKEELVDDGLDNIKAVEKELDEVLKAQNGGNGNNMAKKNKKKLSWLGKFNVFLLVMVFFMMVGFLGAGAFWLKLSAGTPELNMAVLNNETSSVLLDKDGNQFFDLGMYTEGGATYKDISYDQMSHNSIDAFLAIEDSRFFKHKGFDIPRFTKALIENLRAGSFAQGGSTITMQLIKTSHLTSAKNIERKAQEINLALELDKKIGKDKIFEYYVNKINYGAANSRGLESAAQYYFNKSASELNISESAILAGVINRPNAFDPVNNLDKAYIRRDRVIDLMVYHGYIDQEEADLAKAIKIENQLSNESSQELSTTDNPYIDYVNAVIDEVFDRLGIDVVATPLTIYTHMDPKIQEDVAAIQNSEGFQYPDPYMQSAIAIGDNETGALLALGAGRDSQVVKGRNRATRMFQQPGSVTKPLLSYALAFEHLGYATSHVVEDRPIQYAGTNHILGNADGIYRGEMTLKEAVSRSINTPAYATLMAVEQEISRGAVADHLHDNLGFTKVNRENYNTQYAIGGSTFQISPAELFGAQAVMMNGGYYTKPHTVDYVETADNEIIKEEFDYEKTKVISEETAYLVSVLEANNVSDGIINRMEVLGGRPYKVYAKTGTTDYGKHGLEYGIPVSAGKDQWMYASSKAYTSVVWMGWDKPEAGKETWWTNAKYNMNPLGMINKRLLNTIHAGKENPGNVQRPAGISDITHVLSTFPYANPIEDIDEKYITRGEINSKYLKLVDLDNIEIDVETVEKFDADISVVGNEKNITMTWSEYPADGAIKSETYDISLGSIRATGKRLFHPSWVFGPVQYKATIYVDGEILEEISSEENTFSQGFKIEDDLPIKVCGYYGNNKQNGNETCISLENPKGNDKIPIPIFKSKEEVESFFNELKIKINEWFTGPPVGTSNSNLVGQIASLKVKGQDILGREVERKQLDNANLFVSYYSPGQNSIRLPLASYKEFVNWANSNGINIENNEEADENSLVVKYQVDGIDYRPGDFFVKTNSTKIKAFTK